MPRSRSSFGATKAAAFLALGLALASAACGGKPKALPPGMDRFNAALCPKLPVESGSLPIDPNLEGVKADLGVLSRTVSSTSALRLNLTFRNAGLHGLTLSLPRQAFTLAGFNLVDHRCVPVAYVQPPTARALAYGNSGPMPLNTGESATIDSSLDDLAPGLKLAPGIYAMRLNLRLDATSSVVRAHAIVSDWTTFMVAPPK
jgi:hypothetical protein